VRWEYRCLPPGAISSVMVLVGQVPTLLNWGNGGYLGAIALTSLVRLLGVGWRQQGTQGDGRDGYRFWCELGAAARCAGDAFFVKGSRPGSYCETGVTSPAEPIFHPSLRSESVNVRKQRHCRLDLLAATQQLEPLQIHPAL